MPGLEGGAALAKGTLATRPAQTGATASGRRTGMHFACRRIAHNASNWRSRRRPQRAAPPLESAQMRAVVPSGLTSSIGLFRMNAAQRDGIRLASVTASALALSATSSAATCRRAARARQVVVI